MKEQGIDGIGSVVFDNWVIQKKIGEGSFGRVYEIEREDFGHTYRAALKVITVPRNEAELQAVRSEGMSQQQTEKYFDSVVRDIVNEFALMSRLKGTANVVSYEDHTVIRHENGVGRDILIRMELLTPLLTYACEHPFSRREIIQLGIGMCRALELCQKYNIIHRDIKPENIFVSDNGDFKLGDFGIARTLEETMGGLSKKGTYNYMAPEVYRGTKYGFNVDLYSLGIVLYRLLNRNRIPFLPDAPEPITYRSMEQALVRRMSGEAIPAPFYAKGRLAEIVLKACAYHPKERYSSPLQMRQELEAILYTQEDAAFIYPDGDALVLAKNVYVPASKQQKKQLLPNEKERKTSRLLHGEKDSTAHKETTEARTEILEDDKTELVSDAEAEIVSKQDRREEKSTLIAQRKKKVVWIAAGFFSIAILTAGIWGYIRHQEQYQKNLEMEMLAQYQQLMEDGTAYCETDPEQAAQVFLEAQQLFPERADAYVSYSYALYSAGDYEECITYIEDELALGKGYDMNVQSKLNEILGAAYFETEDYTEAAAFFRLSAAGGDITVPAMRDYAVSLGRIGDIEAADEVLQRMLDAGAQNHITTYVQAEVDYAQKAYLDAERGFQFVLNSTDDVMLQKRALRSLAEVYRDCSALARTNTSPISTPATKEAELLASGIVQYGLSYDSTLWEMLALAYFEAYHTDSSAPESYLTRAAECFHRVIELGVQKAYLYSNLYTIYYEQQDYQSAEEILQEYKAAFPKDYTPYALRSMMLITIENEKSSSARHYSTAVAEYEMAGNMVDSDDDTTYYLQLESIINDLRKNGWLS